MSLLQAVLRTQVTDALDNEPAGGRNSSAGDEELRLVNVSWQVQNRLAANISPPSLAHLPTDISRRIFSLVTNKELARCSRVSKKWNQSQTFNFVWFHHYRKEHFRDESLPLGNWTRRESKQKWEIREERWHEEAEASKPTKSEMREMYKKLGGRKARGKGKLGGTSGMRDRGGCGVDRLAIVGDLAYI
ncbi:hypothetical protein C8Q74DRAFT_1445785 [Fomes fomentarius]|nr:hypothetical protein C8Q74DRAFT_1445785 [Fomes fomentarius]